GGVRVAVVVDAVADVGARRPLVRAADEGPGRVHRVADHVAAGLAGARSDGAGQPPVLEALVDDAVAVVVDAVVADLGGRQALLHAALQAALVVALEEAGPLAGAGTYGAGQPPVLEPFVDHPVAVVVDEVVADLRLRLARLDAALGAETVPGAGRGAGS